MKNRKINVAIIAGGLSSEREVSIAGGLNVYQALTQSKKFNVSFIELTPQRELKLRSAGGQLQIPQQVSATQTHAGALVTTTQSHKADVVFLALHGRYGEDGTIQGLLELAQIPYTSSGVLASALAMDKARTNELVSASGVLVPRSMVISQNKDIKKVSQEVIKKIGLPCVVKPNQSGSSIGVSIVRTAVDLKKALHEAFQEDTALIVQQYISGREFSCAVYGNAGQMVITPLPVIEIVTPKSTFFDYHQKYESADVREICPAPLSKHQTTAIQKLAIKAHEIIGCDGVTRSDFIMTKTGKVYFLEINTIPGLTERSLAPQEARVAGISFTQFLELQVELALKKYSKPQR